MKNLKKNWNSLLRITQNSHYLKNVCKTQKKSSVGFTHVSWILNVKLNSSKFSYEPWTVKIDIVNSIVKITFARFSRKIFFSLVINRVYEPLMDDDIPNSIFNRLFPNSHLVTSSKIQNNILKTVSAT